MSYLSHVIVDAYMSDPGTSDTFTIPAAATCMVAVCSMYDGSGTIKLSSTDGVELNGTTAFTEIDQISTVGGVAIGVSGFVLGEDEFTQGATGQDIDWNWDASLPGDSGNIYLIFFDDTDTDTAALVRDFDSDQVFGSGTPSVTINSSSTDTVVSIASRYAAAPTISFSETVDDIIEDDDSTDGVTMHVDIVSGAGASTVTTTLSAGIEYNAILSMSLKASSGGGVTIPVFNNHLRNQGIM